MVSRLICGLSACFLLIFSVGCASSPGVVRGQSPEIAGGVRNAAYYGPANGHVTRAGYDAGSGHHGAPDSHGHCQHSVSGTGDAHWVPHLHHNFYTVDMPSNLRYPMPNTPMAIVQYPYYTVRGPTDFFAK